MLNFSFKSHRTSLKANTTEVQKVFVMLKLTPQAAVAKSRPPLALAIVVDTSSSMHKPSNLSSTTTKLERAIEASRTLIDDPRLVSDDQVTIIHFDNDAKALLPLRSLSKKPLAHEAIDSLQRYSGETYMGKGMQVAKQELLDLPPQIAKRVLLLTDGHTFDEFDCEVLAPQFAESNTPLITIGIGDEYNEELLLKLAQVSQGRPYHLRIMEELPGILDAEVGSSVREVVTDLQATIATVKGVTLESVTRVYPSLSEATLIDSRYRLGNIVSGDFTVFILEFTVSSVERPPSRVRIAQVGLSGHAPGLDKREEFPVQNLFIDFTTDEAAIAAVDTEVLDYVQQKNVDRMVQDAVRLSTVDPGRAQQTLQVAAGMTKRLGNSAVTKMLENALDELNQTGRISAGTAKTVRAGGRTKTMKLGSTGSAEGIPSEEDIRRLTGT